MFRFKNSSGPILIVTLAIVTAQFSLPAGAAKRACAIRSADGTGYSQSLAKFQVYEGLLKATDWSAWLSFMATGTTPGYKVAPVKYKCAKGSGLGYSCHGRTKICKV